jgi:hypothetical protein
MKAFALSTAMVLSTQLDPFGPFANNWILLFLIIQLCRYALAKKEKS